MLAGFEEDKDIILAQQRTLDLNPNAPMLAMRMDMALASFRTMLTRAIAEEEAGRDAMDAKSISAADSSI